jgi:hypothetical protein
MVSGDVPSVRVTESDVVVRCPSAVDGRASEDSIRVNDITRVTLERVAESIHCYLQHPKGWSLHFHDGFDGAAGVITRLQSLLGFSAPARSRALEVTAPWFGHARESAAQQGVAVDRTRRSLRSLSRPPLNANIVGRTGPKSC